MSEIQSETTLRSRVRARRPVLAWMLAVLGGAGAGTAVTLQLLLPAIMPMLSTLCVPAVYVFGGMLPTTALFVLSMASTVAMVGVKSALVLVPGFWLPGFVLLWGLREKRRFYEQMRRAIVASLAGIAMTVLLSMAVYGANVYDSFIEALRSTFNENQSVFWDSMKSYILPYGGVTKERFIQSYNEVLLMLRAYYSRFMVGNLAAGAAMTAVIGTYWGNWLAKRRDAHYGKAFIPAEKWALPKDMTLGLLATLLLSCILNETKLMSAQLTWNIVSPLIETAFCTQAVCSLQRNALRNGKSPFTAKFLATVAICIMLLFGTVGVNWIYAFFGCASALFGSRGAFPVKFVRVKHTEDFDMEKYINDLENEDKEDEEDDEEE